VRRVHGFAIIMGHRGSPPALSVSLLTVLCLLESCPGNTSSRDASPAQGDQRAPSDDSHNTPTKSSSGAPTSGSSRPKKDLMSDACRCGEDVISYSINQARMSILWNRFSFFQLQHYVFARQMYFLLVHLRQPTRCAEKALSYMRTSTAQLEQRLQRQYGTAESGSELSPGSTSSPNDTTSKSSPNAAAAAGNAISVVADEDKTTEGKLLQLRRAQADVWALMSSLKLIRECRALLQLLVGGDAAYNNVFGIAGGSFSTGASTGAGSGSMSYSHAAGSVGLSSAHEAFQDNLAAISSASTHGNSVVYNSLAELNRSQHGISHSASAQQRRASVGGVGAGGAGEISSPLSGGGM
jgi:hypothetical protein